MYLFVQAGKKNAKEMRSDSAAIRNDKGWNYVAEKGIYRRSVKEIRQIKVTKYMEGLRETKKNGMLIKRRLFRELAGITCHI